MSSKLIQSIFFLSICSSIHTMNKKQRDIVRTKLNEKHEITETPKATRTTIKPLPDLKFNRFTIRANHIKKLYNTNQHKQALDSYNSTTENYISSISLLNNTDFIKSVNDDNYLETIKHQNYSYTYDLFDCMTVFNQHNVPFIITNNQDKQLIDLRNKTNKINPSVSYIIQSIYYLKSITENEAQFRYSKLLTMTPETPEVAAICQFLINYGDNTLSQQDITKKFIEAINNCENDPTKIIQTISNCKNNTLSPRDVAEQLKHTVKNQKKSADLIVAIAKSPLFPKILQKLYGVTFASNDPLAPDFNYILAELYYQNNDYTKADSFYKKNKVAFLKEKKVQSHAFITHIATSQSFSKQDINYLSSLVGNIYNQLKQIDRTNPALSYRVGLLIQALVNNNSMANVSEKIMLLDALCHLEYAQRDYSLPITEQQKATTTCMELHTLLSTIYAKENDYITALNHTKSALQYRANDSINSQEYAIATILYDAKNNNPSLYNQSAQWIKNIIDFINNEHNDLNAKSDYALLSDLVESDLCAQLLPYCQYAYKKGNNVNHDIICFMGLSHQHTNDFDNACTYIDTLPQPLSHKDLLLKASIYTSAGKKLSDHEVETLLKSFIATKKPSLSHQKTILYLIALHNNFFIQEKNHNFVITLITKLNGQQNLEVLPLLAEASIILALDITKKLQDTKSPDYQKWYKKLNSCPQFYTHLKAPSPYDGDMNIAAGTLCMQNEPISNYENIISYFTAALDTKKLLPKKVEQAQKTIATLYHNWAMAITDNHSTRIALFDKALQYDNSSELQFKKAMTILNHSDDQDLINNALQILENIPQESSLFALSQIALVQAYCNYSNDLMRIPMLQKLIPLDINKAITYVQKQINNEELVKTFVYTCIKNADTVNSWDEKDIYLKKALEYINILINNNPHNIDYISHRMELHAKFQQFDNAITDINLMLNAKDLSNSRNITKEKLLLQKIELLLPKNLDCMPYDQIIECFEQLKVYDEKNIIHFNIFPRILERTQYLIEHNIVTDKAIEWCCYAANACISADNAGQPTKLSTQQERDLAGYILSAAKTGNLNAQLVALPYCNAITYVSDTNLTEILEYSHKALFNPHNIKKRTNTLLLIDALQVFTKEGVVLAYYILCDYYKGHPQELEKMMLFFNEAKNQDHPQKDASDLIKTICASCKDTLLPYVEHHTNSQNLTNKSTHNVKPATMLTGAIATFTLGAMYQYSDDLHIIDAGTIYLTSAEKGLRETYPQYLLPIQLFLGSAYYKLALVNEKTTNNIDYTLLRQSTSAGYLPAVYKMANIYIDQHKNGQHNIPVKTTDFMHLLARDLSYPASRELFEACQEIMKSNTKDNAFTVETHPTNSNTLLPNQINTAKGNNIIEMVPDRINHITKSTHLVSLVQDKNYKENNIMYARAVTYILKGKDAKAMRLLEKTAKKNHSSACLLLTFLRLKEAVTTKNYTKTEAMLNKSFLCGLVKNNTTTLFHTKDFLNTVIDIINALITDEHHAESKRHLLSIINSTLTNSNINMEAFYALFKKLTGNDLLSVPEWTGKNEIESETPRLISEARKSIVKDINDTEIPSAILKSFTASQQGDKTTAAKEMYFAATTKKIPSAYTFLAWNYLLGIGVTKDYCLAEEYLQEALTHGLIEKQFCSDNFLYTLYRCMSNLISNELLPYIVKKSLLQIIKENLTIHNVDMVAFCIVVKENTNIDLLSVPEWTAHSNNNNNNNQPSTLIINATQPLVKNPDDKNISVKKEQQKLSIDELKRKLVKDPTNNNLSEDFKKALMALIQKDAVKSVILLELAANNNDPCACITMATNYLLGKTVNRKSLFLSMCSLQDALTHGLKGQQFCNCWFLNKLCQFIQHVLSTSYTPDEIKFKKQLLLHIKEALLKDKIELLDFYDIVLNEVKIDLDTCPEWIEAEKNSQFTEEELRSFLNESLEKKDFTIEEFTKEMSNQAKIAYTTEVIQQKNSLIKDENYKDNPDFINATNEMMQGNIKNCINYLKNIAYKDKHPQAYLILSCEYTRGKVLTKNYQEAESCLKKALEYGVSQKQICNHPFLQTLCGQIYATLTDKSFKNIKKKSLSIIKKALKEKNIDLALFEATFEQAYKIKLSTVLEWKI